MPDNNLNENGNYTGTDIMQAPPSIFVPQDEQAVDTELSCEDKEIELTVFDPINNVISSDDLEAEPEEDMTELEEANKKGFFSPVIGMARLVNTLGGRYYAQICIDEKGYRRIEICQEYETGGFSPKIIIKQSDFLRAVSYQFGKANIPNKRLKKTIEDFLLRLSSECLDKFDGTMSFDILKILKALSKCYTGLPVYKDLGGEQTPMEFYHSFMKVMKEMMCWDSEYTMLGHKAYYPLESHDVEYIADKLDMTKAEFVMKLKKYHFLYLTPSSKGYQTNVRITVEDETYTEHRYCILRLNNLVNE